jgi:hypothetical protein
MFDVLGSQRLGKTERVYGEPNVPTIMIGSATMLVSVNYLQAIFGYRVDNIEVMEVDTARIDQRVGSIAARVLKPSGQTDAYQRLHT